MIQFSCEKSLLQTAIVAAGRTVSSKSSIPALEGLLLQANQELVISGYNLQTGIRTKISADITEPGEIVLNARLFGDIIRRMPDDIITLSANENFVVHLRCGDADFDISGLPADDYPELPSVENGSTLLIPRKTLRAMIEETAFAVSTNESRPIHTGALFEITDDNLTIVAVDGFRLAIRREAIQNTCQENFSFVAPGTALNEVKNICGETEEIMSVTMGQKHLLFEAGGTELICRRLEGEFLDYKNAIPRKNPILLTVDTRAFIKSIDRVSVVISEKQKSPVRCVFRHDKVLLSAKTTSGEAKDICYLEGDGNGLEIGFNNRYLIDALRYAPADTVKIELNTSVSPAIIVPIDDQDQFLYMVLPVRLKPNE